MVINTSNNNLFNYATKSSIRRAEDQQPINTTTTTTTTTTQLLLLLLPEPSKSHKWRDLDMDPTHTSNVFSLLTNPVPST
jgi:hypothetical protein